MKFRNRRVSGFHACWMNAAKRAVIVSDNRASPELEARRKTARRERCRRHNSHASDPAPNARRAGACRYCRRAKGNARAASPECCVPCFRRRSHRSEAIFQARYLLARSLEDREIALGGLRPSHRSASRVRAFAHGMTADIVCQQAGDLGAHGFGIAKRNENAASVSQQFLRVPVGCRYDRLSQPEAVGERARRHLRFIEIGRHIDVAHRNEVQQRRLIDELVEEHDMVLDAKLAHARRQAVAICLALMPHKVRMGRAENDIHGVRARLDDLRHGIDHDLDALAWRQQAERQNDRLSAEAEFRSWRDAFRETGSRDSVRDDFDLASRHVMNGSEEFSALFRHDDDFRRSIDDPTHHVALNRRWFGEHRVKRRDDRHFEARSEAR